MLFDSASGKLMKASELDDRAFDGVTISDHRAAKDR
jgi:hypothetical protein